MNKLQKEKTCRKGMDKAGNMDYNSYHKQNISNSAVPGSKINFITVQLNYPMNVTMYQDKPCGSKSFYVLFAIEDGCEKCLPKLWQIKLYKTSGGGDE